MGSSVKVKITNTQDQTIRTFYRMPKTEGSKFSPIIEVAIQPRALLNTLHFANKHYYDEWKRQNKDFFDEGYLIEGDNVKEKEIIAKNEEIIKAENEKASEKSDEIMEKLEEVADNVNAKVTFKEEKMGDKKDKNDKKNK